MTAQSPQTATPTHPVSAMSMLFSNPEFAGQFLRALACVAEHGADLGECFSTGRRIADGDHEAWHTQWMQTADRVAQAAEASLAKGHTVSAREAFLRAATYYRTAFLFMFAAPVDPQMLDAYHKQVAAFRQAAALSSPAIEPVQIPFQGTTLPGYFYQADADGGPRPTLVITGGYDGTAEELHFTAVPAVRRGYHCLTFDGPGQGGVLLDQHMPMRPDWERVVAPVLDYVLTRPEVDATRVALIGRSWGGYLAPRAATGEHRLAACIADPGLYSPGALAPLMVPEPLRAHLNDGDPKGFASAFQEIMQNPSVAFSINRGMLVHGVATPLDYLRAMQPYTLEGIAGQITCPVLICQAENDLRASQSAELYQAIKGAKTLLEFKNADGAGEHCEAGADAQFGQQVFDWLDDALARRS
ncbi:MAG: alpha/beta hydrolase family protein [Dehalococcoidia bacterium]